MAPTEVLARQHARTLGQLLAESRVRMGLLTGGVAGGEREEMLGRITRGELDVVIGTQAIVRSEVEFAKLGLVVVDEQHKFGVRQRAIAQAGRLESALPHHDGHADPAHDHDDAVRRPRHLDDRRSAGRPAKCSHVSCSPRASGQSGGNSSARSSAKGGKAFVVVPLVEESENIATANLEATFEELAHGELEAFRLGLVHGRLPAEEKDAAMQAFREGRTQVLVATSVVEVGIDVPNATLMTIAGAERFGLAQLHQMRGRISRGAHPGYCAVFADAQSEEVIERLQAFVDTTDGFRLAELDLELRGPGDLLGTRQHGLPPFRMADLGRDSAVVKEARDDAQRLVATDPGLQAAGARETPSDGAHPLRPGP